MAALDVERPCSGLLRGLADRGLCEAVLKAERVQEGSEGSSLARKLSGWPDPKSWSEWIYIPLVAGTCGAPRDSTLGPRLFIIFI